MLYFVLTVPEKKLLIQERKIVNVCRVEKIGDYYINMDTLRLDLCLRKK